MIREAQHDVMRWYACGSLLSDVTEWTLGCLTPNMGRLVSFSKRCRALLPCYQYFYFNTYDHKHCHCTLGLPCWLFCWRIWKSKLRKAVSNNLKLCTHVCPKHFHWRKYSEYSKEVKSRNCVQCTYVCPKHFCSCKYSDRGDGQDGSEEDFMESNICPPLTPRTPQPKPERQKQKRIETTETKAKNNIFRLWHLDRTPLPKPKRQNQNHKKD